MVEPPGTMRIPSEGLMVRRGNVSLSKNGKGLEVSTWATRPSLKPRRMPLLTHRFTRQVPSGPGSAARTAPLLSSCLSD